MLIYSDHRVFQKTKTHRLGAVKESDQNRELRGGATQPDSSLNSPGSGKTERNRLNIPYVLTANLRYR